MERDGEVSGKRSDVSKRRRKSEVGGRKEEEAEAELFVVLGYSFFVSQYG
jgi:hypothetical protein